MRTKTFGALLFVLSLTLPFCDSKKDAGKETATTFPEGSTQNLTYENVSKILQDMHRYNAAVQKLDNSTLQQLDRNYQSVTFRTDQKTLFLNVYPDPAGGRIIFLLVPKEPSTGANYLLTFDKKLPVIDSETVELQVRTKDPEKPLTCTLAVPDTAAYMTEYPSHEFVAQYHFKKRFLQSGTYDFDALTVPSYRSRGYAFITFDLLKAEVKDQTANLTATCAE